MGENEEVPGRVVGMPVDRSSFRTDRWIVILFYDDCIHNIFSRNLLKNILTSTEQCDTI